MKIIELLEMVLLLNDGVSQIDLMTKHKFPAKDVIKAKEVLDYIKKYEI